MSDTLEKPKCNNCNSHVVDPHCDGVKSCPWVRCANCGYISSIHNDNYMKGNK